MLAVALLLAGCGSLLPPGPVHLLTGDPSVVVGGPSSCFMDTAEGPLTADPTYGTLIEIRHEEIIVGDEESPYPRLPVVWLPGFTGRWVGSEVEVLDPQGRVVATTGRTYAFAGGFVDARTLPGLPVDSAWFACSAVFGSRPLP
jgi:hypothetical protein